jgi:hypothetical protein
MPHHARSIPLLLPLLVVVALAPTFAAPSDVNSSGAPVTVRPSTLALAVSELAGHRVRVPDARVVGVFEPRVFLIETADRMHSLRGFRDRVIVLIHPGALTVEPTAIVGETVTVVGVARTVLGIQVTGEVPWPSRLDRGVLERLEIRAALLGSSVETADDVELTTHAPSSHLSEHHVRINADRR